MFCCGKGILKCQEGMCINGGYNNSGEIRKVKCKEGMFIDGVGMIVRKYGG